MRYYGHMAHGTSPLYTSVRSLRDLHSLGPSALGCVNSVETCTSVYNLHLYTLDNSKYIVYGHEPYKEGLYYIHVYSTLYTLAAT